MNPTQMTQFPITSRQYMLRMRFSLDGDTGSRLRNQLAGILEQAQISNRGTGAWESPPLELGTVMNILSLVFSTLHSSGTPGHLDHLWFHIDKLS